MDQDARTAEATSGHDWISNSMSFVAYSASGFIACILADYIRRLGYPARAHHALSYQVVVPPILLWAGLGYGRPDDSKKWWWDMEDENGDGIRKIPADKQIDFHADEIRVK